MELVWKMATPVRKVRRGSEFPALLAGAPILNIKEIQVQLHNQFTTKTVKLIHYKTQLLTKML